MFKNYFYLNRAITELNFLLSNPIITDIYSQERNKLYLSIPTIDEPFRHLIISTESQLPYILVKKEHHRAKKNTVNFFNAFLPQKILRFYIAVDDRIIRIHCTSIDIYILIRGPKSNIVLQSKNNEIFSFRKSKSKEDVFANLNQIIFTDSFSEKDFSKIYSDKLEYKDVKKLYPSIIKDIFLETTFRKGKSLRENLRQIVKEIFNEPIIVAYDKQNIQTIFQPSSFHHQVDSADIEKFDSFNSALQKYLSLYFKEKNKNNLRKVIEQYLNKEIKKTAVKLNNLKTRIENGSAQKKYNELAGLLLANISKLKKGLDEIEVEDYISNEKIKIKLDPKLSPKANIDKLFEKSKNEKINFEKSLMLYDTSKAYYDSLKNYQSILLNAQDLQDLTELAVNLKLKNKSKLMNGEKAQKKFRHFILNDKYNIYVGRDSRENDYLSIKFAKQNDYWFHSRGLPGSHVLLRVENTKEIIPKNILKQVASIAAFYSKAKTAKVAPVSYTFAKFVHKKKGMEPGQVLLQRENVLLVKPEIPKNCEPIFE